MAATKLGGYGTEKERRKDAVGNSDGFLEMQPIEIDIPGKEADSENKLRGYKYYNSRITSLKKLLTMYERQNLDTTEIERDIRQCDNGKAVILFSGSAGSNVSQMKEVARSYVAYGYTCYGVDYRGFGRSGTKKIKNGKEEYTSGMITENRLYEDSRIIYNYVVEHENYSPNNVILHGFSLGASIASNLAAEVSEKANQQQGNQETYRLGGLVMHSPMTSTEEMGKDLGGSIGGWTTRGAMGDMNSRKNLKKARESDQNLPLAFISGNKDMGDHLDINRTGIANEYNTSVTKWSVGGSHLQTQEHMKYAKYFMPDLQRTPVQGKFLNSNLSSRVNIVQKKSGNSTGLPANLKSGIESMSGLSMNDVKVHYNSQKPAQMKALAYTQGTDIHIAPGQEQHLGHEAWHVVQQKQGRVAPTTQMKGINVNDSPALEYEADVMGAKAFQFKSVDNKAPAQFKQANSNTIQMARDKRKTYSLEAEGKYADILNKFPDWLVQYSKNSNMKYVRHQVFAEIFLNGNYCDSSEAYNAACTLAEKGSIKAKHMGFMTKSDIWNFFYNKFVPTAGRNDELEASGVNFTVKYTLPAGALYQLSHLIINFEKQITEKSNNTYAKQLLALLNRNNV